MTDVVGEAPADVAPLPLEKEPSDDQLVAAYLKGDQAAFQDLYARYKSSVFGYFKRQLSDAQAQDAFQDTWIKVIDRLGGYEQRGQFSGYLFTIAHNVLMDTHRKEARSPINSALENEDILSDDTPDHALDKDQISAQFQVELKKLPIHQRSVWILKQETALSIEQIAKLTDSTKEGVKSRLRYANEKLKAGMQKYVRPRS